MQPPDQAMVQKYLSATLSKVAAMKKNLAVAQNTLKKQEAALYEATTPPTESDAVAPLRSPSILDSDVDMGQINDAIKRLTKNCDCPNLHSPNFLPRQKGT